MATRDKENSKQTEGKSKNEEQKPNEGPSVGKIKRGSVVKIDGDTYENQRYIVTQVKFKYAWINSLPKCNQTGPSQKILKSELMLDDDTTVQSVLEQWRKSNSDDAAC